MLQQKSKISSQLQRPKFHLGPIQRNQSNQSPSAAARDLVPVASRTSQKRLLKGVTRDTIIHAVENVDVQAVILGLLRSKKEIIRLQTLSFIFDRIQGKSKQDVSVSGGLVHAHVRDPRLAALPQEALLELARAYDQILVKHLPDAAPDSSQNQIESKL